MGQVRNECLETTYAGAQARSYTTLPENAARFQAEPNFSASLPESLPLASCWRGSSPAEPPPPRDLEASACGQPAKPNAGRKSQKLQFRVPTYYVDALDYLARRLGVPTRSDAFRVLVEMAMDQAHRREHGTDD